MPILGRAGENISTRLFGKSGIGQTGQALLGVGTASGRQRIAKRIQQGLNTAGGILNAQASGPVGYVNADVPTKTSPWENAPIVRLPAPKVSTSINTGSDTSRGGSVSGAQIRGDETASELSMLRDMQLQKLNDAYDDEQKYLGNVEKRARGAAGQAISQAQAYYPEFQRLVGEQQTSTEGQIGGLENQRKYESERALGQARQLLNDLQRRQYAQMSATGNYGSSVPEAFADQFGNKAYAAQSQIQQSRDQSLNELAQKRIEAKQYFDQKLFEGKQKYDTLISSLQQQLNQQLDQIGNAKVQSAAAKRQQSLEAWNNYVNNKFSLDQELRNYQNQLTQYAAETEALSDTSTSPWQGTAPEIDNSNTGQIMGDQVAMLKQAPAASQGNYPIYSKRRVLNPLDPDAYGLELSNPMGVATV